MTSPTFTLSLIRELRGSPLTVLVAIMLLEKSGQVPATAQLLKDTTGYGDHTLTDSLRALTSPTRQIVVRVAGGWKLASGFQLPLEIQNRDIRGFETVNAVNVVMVEEVKHLENNINSRDENREIRGFLIAAGIMEPKASKLARLPWMTKEYIAAHVKAIKYETWEKPAGMLIHRLENQYPMPTINPDRLDPKAVAAEWTGHEIGCHCEDCTMVRTGGTRIMCPDCKHYHCECEEETE